MVAYTNLTSNTLGTPLNGEEYEIIKQQNDAISVLNTETERMKNKYANMKANEYNNQRMILLNQSFRDRQQKYLVVMVMFLIVFGISLAIVFMQEQLGYDSFIMDIMIKTVVSFGLITGILMVSSIWERDRIEFSKLSQEGGGMMKIPSTAPSNSAVTANALAEASASGQIGKAVAETCVGAACCGPGFEYNFDIITKIGTCT